MRLASARYIQRCLARRQIAGSSFAESLAGRGIATMEMIRLPVDRLRTARREIWAELRQRDRPSAEAAYARLLQTISHPMAMARSRLVPGTTALQYFLNLLILLRRLFWPTALLLIVVAVLRSWLFLLGLPVLIALELFALNGLQTRLNVELAARLLVLDEHLENFDSMGKE